MSVKSPAMKETTSVSGGGGAIPTQIQAPDFNVVGAGRRKSIRSSTLGGVIWSTIKSIM